MIFHVSLYHIYTPSSIAPNCAVILLFRNTLRGGGIDPLPAGQGLALRLCTFPCIYSFTHTVARRKLFCSSKISFETCLVDFSKAWSCRTVQLLNAFTVCIMRNLWPASTFQFGSIPTVTVTWYSTALETTVKLINCCCQTQHRPGAVISSLISTVIRSSWIFCLRWIILFLFWWDYANHVRWVRSWN